MGLTALHVTVVLGQVDLLDHSSTSVLNYIWHTSKRNSLSNAP